MPGVALDQRQEVNNISKNALPLLHPSRIEKMVFVNYMPPPVNCDDRADYDAWLERVNYLCDDLHWLLQLPHDKFWCQAVFDESLHKALDSFLRFCPRSHDGPLNLPEGGRQRQHELCRLVFMTYLRMSTHKESKENFITPEVFGEILYNNFLFDIPKILDLCSLFGKSNGPLLSKMIGNVFAQQPKYTDDLCETVPTILQVLGNIAAESGIHLEGTGQSPQKLDPRSSGCSLSALSVGQLQDILLYISDTTITLNTFLDIYTPACHVFHKFHICSVIANFYESMIPELYSAVKQQEFPSELQKKQFLGKARQISKCLVSIFRCILQHVCLQPLLDNASNEDTVSSCVEDLLHTMTSVLNERKFLAAYEGMFNFQDDVDLLLQTSGSIDPSQLEYIQAAINSAFATFGRRKSPRGDTNTGGRTSPDGAPDSLSAGATAAPGVGGRDVTTGSSPAGAGIGAEDDFQTEDYGEGAVSCPRPGDAELDSLITSVKDLFPHLGEGFIELALEEFDWNHEKVVSSILEEKLPTSLQEVNFDLPRSRQERETNQGDGQTEKEDVLESRRNVFDNDEFDLFRNKKVDMSKIHLGKKEKKVDLEDKSIIRAVQATYEAYGSMDQESIYENPQMYEDEYDDTYDTNAVGADDADSADELTNKKFMPRVLLDIERKKAREEGRHQDGSDDDDDDDDNNGDQPPRDQFVEDPAKLREQAEQRRQSHAARRGKGGAAPPPRTRDVVGNAKGQGQSAEVLRNRRMKEKFKGQRNRANAEKKLSKGMF